ncbi:MAG: riboflavin synthase [Spirochaetes bacterium]|nr:riboflavin synthase [Spirochaetota bacterium]
MFTGIVEETGKVKSIQPGAKSVKLTIEANIVLDDLKIGDSVSVSGVCLTAAAISSDSFVADVMPQTLRFSAFANLKPGEIVNLERAMRADGRFGGHMVSGHIDGTGTISDIKQEDNAVWVKINTASEILKYIVDKGSVAIDGISLTVAELGEDSFSVSLIPHTVKVTSLLKKNRGDLVNLECDMIGKYVYKFINAGNGDLAGGLAAAKKQSNVDIDFLKKHGF